MAVRCSSSLRRTRVSSVEYVTRLTRKWSEMKSSMFKEGNTSLQQQLNLYYFYFLLGTAVAQWLTCCATNRKFAGSIPDFVMEILTDINPSDRTMALGSTEPLTEMRSWSISWG
jgi:hypothetical protein